MSNYLYFFKSFKNDKSIYKKVIILSIAIILLIIVFSFTKSMNMYIENGIKQDLSYKTLYIDPDFNTNSISLINKIKEIKHVSDAFIDNYSDITVYSNDLRFMLKNIPVFTHMKYALKNLFSLRNIITQFYSVLKFIKLCLAL